MPAADGRRRGEAVYGGRVRDPLKLSKRSDPPKGEERPLNGRKREQGLSTVGQAPALQKDWLAAEVRDEPEEDGERDADDKTAHDWKVESGVFAAVNNVAGQFSQAEWELVPEVEKDTDQNKKRSKED